MKSKLTRLLAGAAAIFMTAAIPAFTAFADSLEGPEDTLTDGTFTYELVNGGYTVVSCDSSAILMSFPETRNGYPITAIADYAFSGCENISEIEVPRTVKSIGAHAFSGCTSLTKVTLPDTISIISEGMFLGCSNLKEVNISDDVTTIGSYAFAFCSRLESFELPSALSYLGDSVFTECTSLSEIKADSNTNFVVENDILLNSAKDKVYRASAALSGSVYLESGITEIGSSAFSGCTQIEHIYIPQGVSKIGDYAFRDCISMTGADIPNGVNDIGTGAFMYCDALETIELPVSLQTLGSSAFMGCTVLRRAIMQEGLSKIGEKVFLGCSQLKTITIPKTVSEIGECAYGYTVGEESTLVKEADISMSVYAGSAGEKYAKDNGIVYSTVDKSLKRTAFVIVAVGAFLAAIVVAAVLMARSRKGAPAGAKKAKKLEKERLEEQSYEKIVDDSGEKKE
ncbi:MAG: leucine-rich repeat protein [Ruminococcus sp.]|nr:leucine-rich repeat protein [Ruminococcus sp.]